MQEIAGILVVLHVGDLDDDGLPAEERQVSLFQPTVKGPRGGALRLRSYPRLTVKPHYMYDQRRVKVPNLGGLCCSQTNDPGLEMAREKWGSKLHRGPALRGLVTTVTERRVAMAFGTGKTHWG